MIRPPPRHTTALLAFTDALASSGARIQAIAISSLTYTPAAAGRP